jgi:hypothetical protein
MVMRVPLSSGASGKVTIASNDGAANGVAQSLPVVMATHHWASEPPLPAVWSRTLSSHVPFPGPTVPT